MWSGVSWSSLAAVERRATVVTEYSTAPGSPRVLAGSAARAGRTARCGADRRVRQADS